MKSVTTRNKSGFICLFILFFVFFALPQAQSFTLEDILSYAFPSNLVVSPKGTLVAWVFNWEGKRNIWIAKGPDYKAQQLTRYSEDDGQELGQLAFNFDGTTIVYVRGGSANRAGENPNPTSNPEGAEQAFWAIKVDGGEPWRLTQGSGPVLSPVENKMAYSARGQIYLLTIDESPKPKVLFNARGRNGSLKWSPDGTRLAFVSSRGDHSFIGIYDLEKKFISWISPSVDQDRYPVWSPCGKYIAFIRFPGSMGTPSYASGSSFTLIVGDVETGKSEEIWQCPNETGGFAQYYPDQTLRWAAEDRLVFYSEHQKWMHLYSVSVKDKKVVCLTPGEYEVENSFLSADGKTLLFNSNSGDIDRRHLWSVP
ncbi:MAG: DPP IV N-terminal domain-containing protein, partial [Candidatus Aminicenantes bacterium]|nr:DPP IV N-terminal domain-containing protein [Candidatus Aminicenantes bacterium]